MADFAPVLLLGPVVTWCHSMYIAIVCHRVAPCLYDEEVLYLLRLLPDYLITLPPYYLTTLLSYHLTT